MNYNHLLLCIALSLRILSQSGCWFETAHLHHVSVWYTLYYYQLAKLSAKQSLLQIVVVYKNSKSTESKLVPEKPKNQIEYKSPSCLGLGKAPESLYISGTVLPADTFCCFKQSL